MLYPIYLVYFCYTWQLENWLGSA